jgi:hypothetical protein
MKSINSGNMGSVELNEAEIDQVSGAIAPLILYGLWMAGGAALGFGAAAAVHYFGNGNHVHAD